MTRSASRSSGAPSVDVDGDHDDRRGRERGRDLAEGGGAHLRVEPAAHAGAPGVALELLRARREPHLLGVREVEREMRGRRVAAQRVHLEAAQDDLLQPGRVVGLEAPRRDRVPPDPLLEAAHPLRVAERADARREEVEEDAEREDVAARVRAVAEDLLGRHVGRRPVRDAELLVHEVRELVVVREAEVDERRLARLAHHDVRRLDVEVDDVLVVEVAERGRDLDPDPGDLGVGERELVELREERLPRDVLHHDVGLHGEVARGDELRHVDARQAREDHLLHLEADDRGRILALEHRGDLHEERHRDPGPLDAPQRRHAARVNEVADHEPVHDGALLDADARVHREVTGPTAAARRTSRAAPRAGSSSRPPRPRTGRGGS